MKPTNKCPRRGANRPGTGQHRVEVLTMTKRTCSIDGCGKSHFARGWCVMHYTRWYRHGDPLWQRPQQGCSIEGCENGGKITRGWCAAHYSRWLRHGDPLMLSQRPTPEDRFWAKVDKHGPDGFHSQTGANLGPCWLWTPPPGTGGYGRLGVDGRMVLAYRFAYELLVGPIPVGLQPDHLCRVRHCVRPDHLEPVTQAENIRRGLAGHLERLRRAADQALWTSLLVTCPDAGAWRNR